MNHKGACACEGVTYTIQKPLKQIEVCHCSICQPWSGGIALFVVAQGTEIEFEGKDNIGIWKSSDHCERGFCKICGSSLYCHITVGPMENMHYVAAGTLKDWDGIEGIDTEIFIDRKPSVYSLEGDNKKMTSTEFYAHMAEIAGKPESIEVGNQ